MLESYWKVSLSSARLLDSNDSHARSQSGTRWRAVFAKSSSNQQVNDQGLQAMGYLLRWTPVMYTKGND